MSFRSCAGFERNADGKRKGIQRPSVCPVCGGKLVQEKDSPIIKCANKNCSVKHRRALYYFASEKRVQHRRDWGRK